MPRIEQLILRQASLTPHNLAVKHGDRELTYAGLVERSAAISAWLRKAGVTPGETVGLYLPRSTEAIAAMLAIWQAGAVLVPLNIAAPTALLQELVADADPCAILTGPELSNNLAGLVPGKVVILNLDELEDSLVSLPPVETGNDACYIFYTSGSQGQPKGVVGLHSSLEQYLNWQIKEFKVNHSDRFSQVAPLSFDFSLKEILVPLLCGASVHLAGPELVLDPEKLLDWLADSRVTTVCCVPTVFRALTQTLAARSHPASLVSAIRHLLISGDILRWEDVQRWREVAGNGISLFNLYGPTESTVIKFFYPIPALPVAGTASVPVGRPITGARVQILDRDDQVCPAGETGQVVILSNWLAQGYRRPEASPAFTSLFDRGEQIRAYRSGDLGRLLPDGSLELCGRQDRQVKIRGLRLELDALEAILASHPLVDDVALVAAGSDDDLRLICFYVSRGGLTGPGLLEFARQRVLGQAVPAWFSRLEQMPLSANGKVNRQALLELIEQPSLGRDNVTVLPADDLQTQVLVVWREFLNLEEIDPAANFFDLGGDSIMVIKMLHQLRKRVHPQISLTDLFRYPTLVEFCDWVAKLPEPELVTGQ